MEPEKEGDRRAKRSKARKLVVRVEGEVAPRDNGDAQLPAVVKSTAAVPIPSAEAMADALTEVKDIGEMHNLHEQAAAWEAVTTRFKLANEEVARIAEFRIRLERKMGAHLAQTVHRGGHGSKFRSGTSNRGGASAGLPSCVRKGAAFRYRALAAIPDELVEQYFEAERVGRAVPSSRRLKKFALRTTGAKRSRAAARQRRSAQQVGSIPADVLDALRRFMRVEVLVGFGASSFRDATVLQPDAVQIKKLRGNVLVTECPDPGAWLPRLAGLRLKGGLEQVVVVVPATTGAEWFKLIEEGKWVCCFPRGSSLVVLYHGARTHGFWTALHHLGALLHAGDHG